MSDTSDPLEILNAIDRERGDSSIGMIQANQVQRLRDEIVALRAECGKLTWDPDRDEIVRLRAALDRHDQHAAAVRDKALEEAIHVIDDISWDWPSPRIEDAESFKAAIRALRTKPW